MNNYTVTFFGHRDFIEQFKYEDVIMEIFEDIIKENGYVDFLVGRNGEFDQFVSSAIRNFKKRKGDESIFHILVLPYMTAEYANNKESFEAYYDEIEISINASRAHYKSAMQIRNQEMADRSDLIICYINKNNGGAFKAVEYAKKQGKRIINLYNENHT